MKYLFYIAMFVTFGVSSQTLKTRFAEVDKAQDSTKQSFIIIEEDSTATIMDAIDLDEVLVVGAYKFDSRNERRQYLILKRKTKKVWPYAVLASTRLSELQERLSKLESGYKKRKYTRIVQNYIEEEFTTELKKLTKTEGQILVKLMYRQTGETTFDIVKELKSGWRAFWYNTTASLFNISLKEKFDPLEVKEDYFIEHILRRGFQKGDIEKHPSAIDINFVTCMQKWN
ncbi:DUF4294 domain-containing protein [Mesonia maritima]|uniref:DUF4294 domain-containing protein n=1 Tax=Mesonia maritima TaxID=1793873 RepID=A0ABU1K701_9FLAO|nr:DUF4294 domain-containing protein [Mesonia maritima]MDR6301388.1 hypothetical protein [Mesonia maritima]